MNTPHELRERLITDLLNRIQSCKKEGAVAFSLLRQGDRHAAQAKIAAYRDLINHYKPLWLLDDRSHLSSGFDAMPPDTKQSALDTEA